MPSARWRWWSSPATPRRSSSPRSRSAPGASLSATGPRRARTWSERWPWAVRSGRHAWWPRPWSSWDGSAWPRGPGTRHPGIWRWGAAQPKAAQTSGSDWTADALLAQWEILEGRPDAACTRLAPLPDAAYQHRWGGPMVQATLAWAHLEMGDVTVADEMVGQAVTRARVPGYGFTLVDALWV